MDHLTAWGHEHASLQTRTTLAERIVDDAFATMRSKLVAAIAQFLGAPLTPSGFHAFECLLWILMRDLGLILLQTVIQALEPEQGDRLPKDVVFEAGGYRRRGDRTRNANIATRFGTIVLWRKGYRSWQRGEETIFPLELLLGLTESVTPALLDLIGKTLATAGMSQQATLAIIREQCGVSMGVKRLRNCLEQLAAGLEPLREACQVDKLLEMLDEANRSSGNRRPVLSVGRDGITLREYKHSYYEVATAATVTVHDRAGKRLGTVYLAHPPEANQVTMDKMLSGLLSGLLTRWVGPLPRLAYVTDSGSSEVGYYENFLRKMKHPVSGQLLQWIRVADYYHASERIWTMANALFGADQEQQMHAWARRMLKKLKQTSGASRVLHSAASLLYRRDLSDTQADKFWVAYRYIQSRTSFMKYHDYRNHHVPLGSGVTEAACKTVYTQRLKLSGMRWTHDGASRVLTLRTILLSGTWEDTYGRYLLDYKKAEIRTYVQNQANQTQNAA